MTKYTHIGVSQKGHVVVESDPPLKFHVALTTQGRHRKRARGGREGVWCRSATRKAERKEHSGRQPCGRPCEIPSTAAGRRIPLFFCATIAVTFPPSSYFYSWLGRDASPGLVLAENAETYFDISRRVTGGRSHTMGLAKCRGGCRAESDSRFRPMLAARPCHHVAAPRAARPIMTRPAFHKVGGAEFHVACGKPRKHRR